MDAAKPTGLSRSEIYHRLAMMWFANVYPQFVRGKDIAPFAPSDTPPEYLPPYPNPWYWPQNTIEKKTQPQRMTALEAVRPPTVAKDSPTEFPTWLEF